ncbi:MAG TPA: Crp/Fnr family transcriptional regulator [Candidatus Eremiobacteraceae bacterium]|nr:Crp/Fnr family transcriptional regulator [Candidatus Eremiobacteraceae bacterium]
MKSKQAARRAIASVELFRDLPIKTIEKLVQGTGAENLRAGHIFFKTGDPGKSLYVLETGHVQTFRNVGDRKLIIADLEAPAVFGEMGCVGKRMYHCVAEATKPSVVRAIPSAEVDALAKEFPSLTQKLLDLVSLRFVSTLLELEASSFRHLTPRLAKLLLEKAEGDCVKDFTHAEIAERLRVYRESATSAIGELRKAGIIAVERKRIRILDRPRLERAARE